MGIRLRTALRVKRRHTSTTGQAVSDLVSTVISVGRTGPTTFFPTLALSYMVTVTAVSNPLRETTGT